MSAASSDTFYGWNLLYKTIETDIKNKDDVLMALAHFVLTKHAKLKCIGIGDKKTLPENCDEIASELLPDNWNGDDSYAIRYIYNKELVILMGLRTEQSLIVTLFKVAASKTTTMGLGADDLVKNTRGKLDVMIPTASVLAKRFLEELYKPLFSTEKNTVATQTSRHSLASFIYNPVNTLLPPFFEPYFRSNPTRPIGFPVGMGDLDLDLDSDPLDRCGPGNLYPFPQRPDVRDIRQGGRPRFGPLHLRMRPNPIPDHMRLPYFDDDIS